MGLLAIEGFETFTTNDGDTGQFECEDAFNAKYVGDYTQYGRPRVYDGWNSGKAISLARTGSGNWYRINFTADDEIVVGFAYKPKQIGGIDSGLRAPLVTFYDGDSTVDHVSVWVNRCSDMMVFRGGSWTVANLLGTIYGACRQDKWTYVEIRVLIHDTTGQVEIKLDGVQVLSLTNQDTRNGGTAAQVTDVEFNAQWSDGTRDRTHLVDDIYILDTSGGQRTTFLGPHKVEAIFPNAEGTNIDFTPSTGTDNSALVDENPTSMTDYNESSTTGHYDLLDCTTVSVVTGGIKGIQVNIDAKISDATTYDMFPTIYSGTTQSDGTTETISEQTDWQTEYDVWEQNPDTTTDWTTTTIGSLEIGYEVA